MEIEEGTNTVIEMLHFKGILLQCDSDRRNSYSILQCGACKQNFVGLHNF